MRWRWPPLVFPSSATSRRSWSSRSAPTAELRRQPRRASSRAREELADAAGDGGALARGGTGVQACAALVQAGDHELGEHVDELGMRAEDRPVLLHADLVDD